MSYQESLNDNNKSGGSNPYSQTISTADGKYELIKSQLGNYPNNLVLNDQITNNGTLSDLVDKSMANGIFNINVGLNTILPTKKSSPNNLNYVSSDSGSNYDPDDVNISSYGNDAIDFKSPIPIVKSLNLATPIY